MIQVIKQIQIKRGNKADLEQILKGTLKPLQGEPVWELDTNKLKIGDGIKDYINLPYIESGNIDFIVEDPLNNEILIYDEQCAKWVNKKLADNITLIHSDDGLTISGFKTAKQGQVLTKDNTLGIVWTDPVSDFSLQQLLHATEEAARAAAVSASNAETFAGEANTAARIADRINQLTLDKISKMFWTGTVEEYNSLEEINEGTTYFIKRG